ncbi:hypothetical protein BGZ80_009236 [Entomortierella chlamydospora]|uniref:Uncharacterized protein n=1 Tax=Entomortierella chlamydospora TaxID=101097 RepID=A0A9P6MXW5_9FUNG|nr:hypothetical protein BGZ79_009821 [Entomortierella chlamydospora]KAG0016429.1 hypothetical protein BGZ80_009236 [Entomortierella chlamydospora]
MSLCIRRPLRAVPTFNGVSPLEDNYVPGFETIAVTDHSRSSDDQANPPIRPQQDPSTNPTDHPHSNDD